jgi:hypothetical protein
VSYLKSFLREQPSKVPYVPKGVPDKTDKTKRSKVKNLANTGILSDFDRIARLDEERKIHDKLFKRGYDYDENGDLAPILFT